MTKVVVVFTLRGDIIGEQVARADGKIVLRRPHFIQAMQDRMMIIPCSMFVDEDDFEVSDNMLLFKGTFTPDKALKDGYLQQTSGIQIAPASSILR